MTRAGHADVLVRELKEKLTERETHLSRAMREIKALRERLDVAEAEVDLLRERVESQPATVPAVRRYELAVEESENGGPQPVKWWKD
jgi:chromosome segregation ATPase